MRKQNILIVDDDVNQLKRYAELAKEAGFDVQVARKMGEAFEKLSSPGLTHLLTDIHLREKGDWQFEGLQILERVRTDYPEILPLIMSADPNIETYNKALELGALYYLRKPIIDVNELLIGLQGAKNKKLLEVVSQKLLSSKVIPPEILELCPDGIVLDSLNREKARKIALNRKIPGNLFGETGTGKEEVAKLIHRKRCAVEGPIPFVAVNCANLTKDMASSLMFGHKKGAFTGANETTNGHVGEANGGILFLDEVHTLSKDCQQGLLRVLNDGSYSRLGDPKTLHSDFQVVIATTKNLDDEVEAGNFLVDLRMRLGGIEIELAPLRERHAELPLLVSLFFAREGIDLPKERIEALVEKCKSYQWKGNIRQLYKSLQALVALADSHDEISAEHLVIKEGKTTPLVTGKPRIPGVTNIQLEELFDAIGADKPLSHTLEHAERLAIQSALARHEKVIDSVTILDVSRSGFDLKRKKYNL